MATLTTDKLPFPLGKRRRPPSDKLPFALSRKLGDVGDTHTPITPIEPPKVKRRMSLFGGCADGMVSGVSAVSACQNVQQSGNHISHQHHANPSMTHGVSACHRVFLSHYEPLKTHQSLINTPLNRLVKCQFVPVLTPNHTQIKVDLSISPTVHYKTCVAWRDVGVQAFKHCQTWTNTAPAPHRHCVDLGTQSTHRANCQTLNVSPALIVPCRFYPVPEPPPPPDVGICQIRPPSDRLPISLRRKSHQKQGLSAESLPFNLTCWHDIPPASTPNKRSYIMHHNITAMLDDVPIDPISFSIKTDMDSFCWQGQVEISPDDFIKIKSKLTHERGQEPFIKVVINDQLFAIIAEDMSKNRSFINHSYTLSGRSVTAHLSKDYANIVKLDADLYASQIVGQALNDLPIGHDFGVADWRTHITMTGTPISIIDHVAKACGAFVMSDKAEGKLSVRPRYKVPAWELTTATPDHVLPLDVIKSISEQKQVNPRYNAVILTSNTDGAVVYRQEEAQDKHAPTQTHELYTDQACIIPAGVAILSDSGTHQMATLTMPWVDGVPLAELGQIWQVNDKVGNTDDAWRAVVKSVAIDVKVDDGVPSVWQTVGLDRYLDN